jgi:phenylacetic acid degradation protein paaN
LPLAITVSIARDVLAEAGFSPNLVTLVAENPGGTVASELAVRPEVRIVDFTGSTAFGQWLEEHARQAAVYTEKAGVNMVLVDSTDDYAGMLANLAFSLCLYSGQMCTTPQDLLVPADGVGTPEGRKSVDEFAADLGAVVEKLLGPDAQAVELLGAIVNDGVLSRVDGAGTLGTVVIPSRTLTHPAYPQSRVRTPALVRVPAERVETWGAECFGPVSFLVVTDTTEDALELIRRTVTARGALTAAAYSTDEKVVESARAVAIESGVALSENLTGGVYVNQTAAYSDLHATGANPAANAAYTDAHFVAGRFRVIQTRRHTT